MNTGQKIVTAVLWAILVAVMAGVVGVGVWQRVRAQSNPATNGRKTTPDYAAIDNAIPTGPSGLPIHDWSAPAFSLINQDGKLITTDDLHGHPWIASFIFTQCAGPCPMISGKMARLQKAIADPSIKLVSFTVDPVRDTPAVLKQYAKNFNADPARWSFLTGTQAQMDDVAMKMKIASKHPDDGSLQVEHGTQFLLLDTQGRVRGIYRTQSGDGDEMQRLADDAAKLANEGKAS